MGDFQPGPEEVLFSGRVIRLARAQFTDPDGHRFEREIVHHPGAVAIVPLHPDGTITVLRQFRAPLGRAIVEIPAGLHDVDGEPPAVTAARELAEETGLAAARMDPLCVFHNSPGFADEEVHIFVATGLTEVPLDRQGVEERHMVIERIHRDESLGLIQAGDITDAKTVIALSLLAAGAGPAG